MAVCCDGYFLLGDFRSRARQKANAAPESALGLPLRPSSDPQPFRHFLRHTAIPISSISCYALDVACSLTPKGASAMEWVTPRHEEIDLNCEVSSYANAEL
jgi:hypothetical protein